MKLALGARLADSLQLPGPEAGSCDIRHQSYTEIQLHATTYPALLGKYLAAPGIITEHGSRIADVNVYVSSYASDIFSLLLGRVECYRETQH